MPLPPLSRRLVRLGHSLSAQDLDPVQAIVFANGREGLLTLRVLARMRCTSIPHHRALFTQFRLAFEDEYVPPLVDSSSEDADTDDDSSESDVSLGTLLASLRPRAPLELDGYFGRPPLNGDAFLTLRRGGSD